MIYPVLTGYFMRAALLLLLAGMFNSQALASVLILEQCGQEEIALERFWQFYKDEDATKKLIDIQQIVEQAWQPVDRGSLAPGFTLPFKTMALVFRRMI